MYLRIQFWNFLALNELISNKAIDQQAQYTYKDSKLIAQVVYFA